MWCPPLAPRPMGEAYGPKVAAWKSGSSFNPQRFCKWLVPAGNARGAVNREGSAWRTFDAGVLSATRVPAEMPRWVPSRVVDGRVRFPPGVCDAFAASWSPDADRDILYGRWSAPCGLWTSHVLREIDRERCALRVLPRFHIAWFP